jgi:acyl-CoA thioester hydrolase
MSTHHFSLRIYYEDTDFSGLVYHANYLKFLERARTEFLRDHGLEQTHLFQDKGLAFVVRHLEIDFHRPARMDDNLIVETRISEARGARLVMDQRLIRDETLLLKATVTLAVIDRTHKLQRLSRLDLPFT